MKFLASLLICSSGILSLFAQDANELFQTGNTLSASGKSREAIKYFTKAIEADDHQPQYFLERAKAYKETHDYNLAYADLVNAIKLDNTFAEAFYERALLFGNADRYREAINDLDVALKYAVDDKVKYKALSHRSSYRLSTRNFRGSYEDGLECYMHDSSDYKILNNMALAKMEMGAGDEGLTLLFPVLEDHPKDTMVLNNIGYISLRLEKYDTALVYLQKARRLDPKNSYALSNLSFAKLKTGNVKEALKDINESIKYDGKNSYAFLNRAYIYLEMEDKSKACDDLKTALRLGFTDLYGNEVLDLLDKHCNKK